MYEPPAKKDKESTTITLVVRSFRAHEMEQFSPVKRINGYPWRLRYSRGNNKVCLSVVCDKSKESELWKCTARIEDGGDTFIHEFVSWDKETHAKTIGYYYPKTMGTRFDVDIFTEDDGERWRCRPSPSSMISVPDRILLVGDEKRKIEVDEWDISRASSFFRRLFNGNFKETKEIPINDVEYEDFNNIIKIVLNYRNISALTDEKVEYYLELAGRFDFKIVEDKVASFLLSSASTLPFQQKLTISEQYNIPFYKSLLAYSLKGPQLLEVCKSPEWDQLSKETIRIFFEITSDRCSQDEEYLSTPAKENDGSNTISMVVGKWKENEYVQFSQVKRINGYPWSLVVYRNGPVELICDKSNEAALWKCSATASFKIDGDYVRGMKHCFASWYEKKKNRCIVTRVHGEGETIEVSIETIEDGDSWRLNPVLDQLDPRDGILVIGEEKKKLYVNKESLAKASPFFDRLFNDCMEKNMSEIPIGDVGYEEFCNLIRIAYRFDGASLTDDNVHRILQLADKFELKIVEDSVISFLLSPSSSLPLQKKLLISEKLPFFKESLLNHPHSRKVLKELCSPIEWNQLPNNTIRALFEKMCARI